MGSTGILEDWLKKNHNVRDRSLTPRKMQAYRHAWLQSLIAEYSK
jgi:deoxyadenosine/deoxycytidine kinase